MKNFIKLKYPNKLAIVHNEIVHDFLIDIRMRVRNNMYMYTYVHVYCLHVSQILPFLLIFVIYDQIIIKIVYYTYSNFFFIEKKEFKRFLFLKDYLLYKKRVFDWVDGDGVGLKGERSRSYSTTNVFSLQTLRLGPSSFYEHTLDPHVFLNLEL